MKTIPHRHHAAGKRKIRRRLDRPVTDSSPDPVFTASNIHYEVADKTRAVTCGGIGAIQLLVRKLGLAEAIDERLHLLKFHFPYHESDHVLNFAYNALCNGTCLDDIELRRNDVVFLDALGADRIPDPTTAGDFCRRFTPDDVEALQDVFDRIRVKVWKQQPSDFFDEAVIDADGTLVATGAGSKQGVDIAYDGTWGYHPLIVSLANTGEVLSIVNRSGNRPSHEGAAEQIDLAILLCRDAGFRRIYVRGDTDFTQTKQLDAWDAEAVTFLFGIDAMPNLKAIAEDRPASDWAELQRPPQYTAQRKPRKRPEKVKDRIVRERGYKTLTRVREDVAEVAYRPTACQRTYRLILVRQTIKVEKGQLRLHDEVQYRFYLTNDRGAVVPPAATRSPGACGPSAPAAWAGAPGPSRGLRSRPDRSRSAPASAAGTRPAPRRSAGRRSAPVPSSRGPPRRGRNKGTGRHNCGPRNGPCSPCAPAPS